MAQVTQMFPRKAGSQIVHHKWTVDLEAAAQLQGWPGKYAGRLAREVQDMATHFPRWLLSVMLEGALLRCRRCEGILVFDRGLRCVACGEELARKAMPRNLRLSWFGLMPPIGIDGLKRIADKLVARPPKDHLVGFREGTGHYLLVPLLATYQDAFPDYPPTVAYLPGFFSIPGVPAPAISHAFHMLGQGVMCLFASGQWSRETTCREVLQQRAYPHVVKFLNYANGKREAFAIVS